MHSKFALPDLEERLRELGEGAVVQISRRDCKRLFGLNDAALGRLRNFASSHQCVASFADTAVLFRKRVASLAWGGRPVCLAAMQRTDRRDEAVL
ncbi:hypothetical protein ABIF63_008606 [Bradyrhizobium japonicum]|uniref:Uncharacterized protein n=1 Tax=Bradyrhizobium japonicum TaxID=375 RepID=A0ABV2S6R7_BRAJP